MAHSATDYAALRDDLALTMDSLDSVAAAAIFDRADAKHPTNTDARDAYARVLTIKRMLAGAIKLVDYTEGESTEKLSQIAPRLQSLLELYTAEEDRAVQDAAKASGGGIRWGALKPVVKRWEEYPDD